MIDYQQKEMTRGFSRYTIFSIMSLLLLGLGVLDIFNNTIGLNFRTWLEFFIGTLLLSWSIWKIIPDNTITLYFWKGIGSFWALLLLFVGLLGYIDIHLNITLLDISGNALTVIAFTFGLFLLLNYWRILYEYFLDFMVNTIIIRFYNSIIVKFYNKNLARSKRSLSSISPIKINVTGILILVSFLITFTILFLFLELTIYRSVVVTDSIRNSLFTGSIYILLGIGLTLIYKILNFANFAYGELIIFGPYITVVIIDEVFNPFIATSFGESNFFLFLVFFLLSLGLAFIFSGVLALLLEFLIFRQLRKRNATPASMMIASIGAAFVIRFLIIEIFTRNSVAFFILGQQNLIVNKFIVIFLAIFFVILLDLIITRTKIGKSMRAVANNPQLAQASGISITFVIIIVWIIGAGFAGIAGTLKILANTPLTPLLGFRILLPTFAVVILGGIGSYRGAILAGYIVGFAENIGTLLFGDLKSINEFIFPGLLNIKIPVLVFKGLDSSIVDFNISFTFQPAYQLAWGFLFLIIVLLIKPTGIFGEKIAKDR